MEDARTTDESIFKNIDTPLKYMFKEPAVLYTIIKFSAREIISIKLVLKYGM
jgi:hypothetical protein